MIIIESLTAVFEKFSIENYNSNNLFAEGETKNIIIRLLGKFGKEELYQELEYSDMAPPDDRYDHTLSAFLLGLTLRNEMHIDMRNLPHVVSKNSQDNFYYFWILICLYHDCAYYIENHISAEDCPTVEAFVKKYRIKNSFLEESEYKELFTNYYNYRINRWECIDHGIAGALLLYDRLFNLYEKNKENPEKYKYLSFSKSCKKHILLVANTIARHNIYTVDEDDIEGVEYYKHYNLNELIQSSNRFSKVTLDEESENEKIRLLFLLELVDTIEPLKTIKQKKDKDDVSLEKVSIEFKYKDNQFVINYPNNYVNLYNSNISDWLGVILRCEGSTYSFEFERIKKKELICIG